MKAIILDGTPDEIAEALNGMKVGIGKSNLHHDAISLQNNNDDDADCLEIPKFFAKRVLSRIGLSENQKILLKSIYDTGDDGILTSELTDALKIDQSQFRGVMGSFGRRVTGTDGYSTDYAPFIDWEWDSEAGSCRYRLVGEVREAVKEFLNF